MTESIEAWQLSFDSGKKWFNTITAKRTKEMYSNDMKQYWDAVGKSPTELLALKLEGLLCSYRFLPNHGIYPLEKER